MTEHTKIEWCDHTFNPWIGCTRVSEGCRNCYAERMAGRFGTQWGPGAARKPASEAAWRLPLRWNARAERTGTRERVFCASMADVMDDHLSIDPTWRVMLADLIYETEYLDWLLLTKRPENIRRKFMAEFDGFDVPPNVRIGVSVEDQETADQRIPELLRQWDGPNFVSYEPALGGIDFRPWLGWDPVETRDGRIDDTPMLHWIIAGGESGPGARPAHPDWFRSVRDQCDEAGVPFFFKQWGEWLPVFECEEGLFLPDDGTEGDAACRLQGLRFPIRRIGADGAVACVAKKRAGRWLDGREWDEFPR